MTDMTTAPAPARRMNPMLERYYEALFSTKGMIAVGILVILCGLALLAPLLFPGGYDVQTRASLKAASWAHPFGTDELGRDIFVRSIFGLRVDLSLIFTAVLASMAIGTILGLLGAVSARLGNIVQRLLDIIAGFPGLILGICIVVVVGPGWLATDSAAYPRVRGRCRQRSDDAPRRRPRSTARTAVRSRSPDRVPSRPSAGRQRRPGYPPPSAPAAGLRRPRSKRRP